MDQTFMKRIQHFSENGKLMHTKIMQNYLYHNNDDLSGMENGSLRDD